MDRLQTMSTFVTVADEGGFAPAARKLKRSPPSVTRAISELESRLGTRLLHRTTRSLRLTDAGARYLADCRRILSEIEEADRQAASLHREPKGLVSVSASVLFGRLHVAPLLLQLLDRYPGLSVSAVFVDRVVHLLEEGIDIAVRIAELPDSSLSAIRVGRLRRVLCASPDYLEAHGRPRRPADLAAHRTVSFAGDTAAHAWTFGQGAASHRFRPESRFVVNNADAAIAAAAAGYGVTRVLSYMVAPQLRAGRLEVLLEGFEPPPVPVHVLHKEAGQTSARVRAVVDHLVERLREEPTLAN